MSSLVKQFHLTASQAHAIKNKDTARNHVLINDRLVDDWGRNLQVSSTLRCLAKAGWEVVESSHGIPVSYIPMGLDATIAYDFAGFKDDKFYRCASHHRCTRFLGEIKAKIYGRKGDISIEVESFILKEIPAKPRTPAVTAQIQDAAVSWWKH